MRLLIRLPLIGLDGLFNQRKRGLNAGSKRASVS